MSNHNFENVSSALLNSFGIIDHTFALLGHILEYLGIVLVPINIEDSYCYQVRHRFLVFTNANTGLKNINTD